MCPKYDSQDDDQRYGSHDVVDNSSNIAANSNSVEGLGSVPLFNRARVTQGESL